MEPNPENKFESVGCKPRATARPPTPNAPNMGTIEIPKD